MTPGQHVSESRAPRIKHPLVLSAVAGRYASARDVAAMPRRHRDGIANVRVARPHTDYNLRMRILSSYASL